MYSRIYTLHREQRLTGVLLIIATLIALTLDNTQAAHFYRNILHTPIPVITWNIHQIINEGLMVIFFFYIGLEIKHEMIAGDLQNIEDVLLPLIAAFGGIIAPAAIYYSINLPHPHLLSGWAIPTATDIAFAIGLLAAVSCKVPKKLKILLVSIAIFDDLFAILVIALFYSQSIDTTTLSLSLVGILIIILMANSGIHRLLFYVLPAIVVWYTVLQSGIHTTVSGFLIAIALPLIAKDSDKSNMLALHDKMKPWVEYGILPIFAFANAGVHVLDFHLSDLYNTVTTGIFYGLYFGKPIGICTALGLFILAKPTLLKKVSFMELLGMSFFCGIGFTMSLFIGGLAFGDHSDYIRWVKVGVLLASVLAGITGYIILYIKYRLENQGAKNA